MSMIDIRTIKILLDTNIPGKEVIPFTKSILYYPDTNNKNKQQNSEIKMNEYPYFTMDVEYPEMYLSSLGYTKQLEFFFNKQKMSEILQLKTNIKEASSEEYGLTSKNVEKEYSEKIIKENVEKQRSDMIQTEQFKQKQFQKEEKEKSEKQSRFEKLETEEKEEMEKINAKLKKNIESLDLKTIEQIEGNSSVTYTNGYKIGDKIYQTIDEYITNKKTENEEIATNVKQIIGLEKIKEIFKPNPSYLTDSTGGVFGLFSSKNIENVDENNLYKDEFCLKEASQKGNTVRLFDINENTLQWNTYKDQILSGLKRIQTNGLFEIPEVDVLVSVISNIEEVTIDYDKYNGDGDTWKEIDQQLCRILPQVRKVFDMIQTIQVKIEEYPQQADLKIDEFMKAYATAKIEFENSHKEEKGKIEESFFEKKNGEQMFVGGANELAQPPVNNTNGDSIAEKNVMIMLRMLFPTKYPIIGNVFSSFHSVITGKNEFYLKWTDFIPGFFKRNFYEGMNEYSYIKLDGKVFTVIQAIWLNDIYNHKEYKKLVEQFEQLQKWKKKEARKSEIDVLKMRDKLIDTFTTNPDYELNDLDVKNIKDTLKSDYLYREAQYSLAEYKLSVTTLIDIMKNIIVAKGLKNKDNIIEYYKNFSDLFLELETERLFNPSNQPKYEKMAMKIKEDIYKYESNKHILKTYLQSPGINMEYENDKYRTLLKEKYGLYITFIENIRKYRAPILESSNSFLQASIDDFLNKTEKYKGVFNFLINPLNIKKNPYEELLTKSMIYDVTEIEDIENEKKHYLNRFNTGITIRPSAQGDEPYYEIYVELNVLGGELNDSNKSKIDCMYQGESLTDKLSRILNEAIYHPWNINSSRIFIDITNNINTPPLNDTSTNSASLQSLVSTGGGGGTRNTKSIRKHRELLIRKTRKYYS